MAVTDASPAPAPPPAGRPTTPAHRGSSTAPIRPATRSSAPASPEPYPDYRVKNRKIAFRPRKAFKDTRVYKVAMAVVALRAQGLKGEAIAEQLGIPANTVSTYLKRAVARGWLNLHSFDQSEDKVEYVLVDQAIKNAQSLLSEGDKEMTIETLKGTGVFKQHQAVKVDQRSEIGMALRVQFELPPAAAAIPSSIAVRPETVGGARSTDVPIDAEIIETQE